MNDSAEKSALLPREARDGLMRAWLAILHERHPEFMWLPVHQSPKDSSTSNMAALAR